MINAKVIADSVSDQGKRIITLSLVYPRFILAELNTHRVLSRNSASSRAIPTKKLLDQVRFNPAMPVAWGANRPGMQATEEIKEVEDATAWWHSAALSAVYAAEDLLSLGLHKQIVNRVLEPFMHAHTVVTATEWDNFFNLRRHKDAQPEIKALADAMWDAMKDSVPQHKNPGEWHTPYYQENEDKVMSLVHSVARCARVSYVTHEGKQSTAEDDLRLYNRLAESGHWSPFEHQATPINASERSNNFIGWKQYRAKREAESFRSLSP